MFENWSGELVSDLLVSGPRLDAILLLSIARNYDLETQKMANGGGNANEC